MFKAASEKLGVGPEVVEHGVDGLAHLFTEVHDINMTISQRLLAFCSHF